MLIRLWALLNTVSRKDHNVLRCEKKTLFTSHPTPLRGRYWRLSSDITAQESSHLLHLAPMLLYSVDLEVYFKIFQMKTQLLALKDNELIQN